MRHILVTLVVLSAALGVSGCTGAGDQTSNPTGITQPGHTLCEYRVDPMQIVVPVGGTSGAFSVTTATGCAWTAASREPFVQLSGQTSQVGSGTVAYTMEAHPAAGYFVDFRRAELEVRGDADTSRQNVLLVQAPDCNTGFSLPGPQRGAIGEVNLSAAGGRQVIVTYTDSPFRCPWRVEGGADWLQTAPSGFRDAADPSGFNRGDGEVAINVDANASSIARTAVLWIGGRPLTVRQAGR